MFLVNNVTLAPNITQMGTTVPLLGSAPRAPRGVRSSWVPQARELRAPPLWCQPILAVSCPPQVAVACPPQAPVGLCADPALTAGSPNPSMVGQGPRRKGPWGPFPGAPPGGREKDPMGPRVWDNQTPGKIRHVRGEVDYVYHTIYMSYLIIMPGVWFLVCR